MIGKGKAIAHTRASMLYGWNQEKNAQVVFRQHLAGEAPGEISQEFRFIQDLNQNCSKNTFSFVLSPTVEDGRALHNRELDQLCRKFMQQMKLGERQAIGFVHQDKAHKHIHLYVNRIDFKGAAFNDSFIGKRSQQAAERVAEQLGLTTVKQVQFERLVGLQDIRAEIKGRHDLVLRTNRPRSFKEYMKTMETKGIKVIPSINKGNKLQGFRFEFQGHNLKGSEVHRSMSLGNIGKKMSKIRGNHHFIKKDFSVALPGKTVQLSSNMAMSITKNVIKRIISQGIGY